MHNPNPAGLPLSHAAYIATRTSGTNEPDVRPETQRTYERVGRELVRYFGDICVSSITRQMYSEWHNHYLHRGDIGSVSKNNYRRNARAIWNRLKKRGISVCNIDDITKLLPTPKQISKATDRDWFKRVAQLAAPRDLAILLLTRDSGMRRQSIPRLRVDQTNIWESDRGELRIASYIAQEKTSAPRPLFGLHKAALAVKLWLAIREIHDSPWLFYNLNTGNQLTPDGVNEIFKTLRKRGNVPKEANLFPHGLRHLFAQEKLTQFDIKLVAQWMGIDPKTVALVYAHRSDKELERLYFGDSY